MAKMRVFYDYFEDGLSPIWMVISFKQGELDWDKQFMYIPVEAPFKRLLAEDFVEIEMGLTVTLVDLTMNADKERQFGISLSSIKSRVNQMRGRGEFPYTLDQVQQFIIQICDIEEVLACDRNDWYAWR